MEGADTATAYLDDNVIVSVPRSGSLYLSRRCQQIRHSVCYQSSLAQFAYSMADAKLEYLTEQQVNQVCTRSSAYSPQ